MPPDHGPWLLKVVEGDTIGARSLFYPGTGGSVHVSDAGIDTRTDLADPTLHGFRGRTWWTACQGEVTVTLMGRGLVLSEHTNQSAAYLSFYSAAPFRLLGVRGGSEVALGSGGNMDGGSGVEGFAPASAAVGDSFAAKLNASVVRATVGSFAMGRVSQVKVDHPAGQETLTHLAAENPFYLEDGPGAYSFQVDHAGDDGLYVGAWAVEPIDFSAGRERGPAGPGP